MSYDNEIYLNPNSKVFKDLYESLKVEEPGTLYKVKKGYAGKEALIMEDIINFLMRSKLSITYDHDHWYKVAYGLANTFPYKQPKIFICAFAGWTGRILKNIKVTKILIIAGRISSRMGSGSEQ